MNTITVENILVSALSSSMGSIAVVPGTGTSEVAIKAATMIVLANSVDHSVGNLYKAQIEFRIHSPALVGTDSLTALNGALNALESAIPNLSSLWPGSAAYAFGGTWFRSSKITREETFWNAAVEIELGLGA